MDSQRVTQLVLLDLRATLRDKFGVTGTALEWLRSYLTNCLQCVRLKGVMSEKFDLRHGVPQGSCLASLLFSCYTS